LRGLPPAVNAAPLHHAVLPFSACLLDTCLPACPLPAVTCTIVLHFSTCLVPLHLPPACLRTSPYFLHVLQTCLPADAYATVRSRRSITGSRLEQTLCLPPFWILSPFLFWHCAVSCRSLLNGLFVRFCLRFLVLVLWILPFCRLHRSAVSTVLPRLPLRFRHNGYCLRHSPAWIASFLPFLPAVYRLILYQFCLPAFYRFCRTAFCLLLPLVSAAPAFLLPAAFCTVSTTTCLPPAVHLPPHTRSAVLPAGFWSRRSAFYRLLRGSACHYMRGCLRLPRLPFCRSRHMRYRFHRVHLAPLRSLIFVLPFYTFRSATWFYRLLVSAALDFLCCTLRVTPGSAPALLHVSTTYHRFVSLRSFYCLPCRYTTCHRLVLLIRYGFYLLPFYRLRTCRLHTCACLHRFLRCARFCRYLHCILFLPFDNILCGLTCRSCRSTDFVLPPPYRSFCRWNTATFRSACWVVRSATWITVTVHLPPFRSPLPDSLPRFCVTRCTR